MRFMISGIISFVLGILFLQGFSFLPSLNWCWAFFLILCLPFLSAVQRNILLFFIGFLWAVLRAHLIVDVSLPDQLQQQDLLVTGVITSIPQNDSHKQRFDFVIENALFKQKVIKLPAKVRLSYYHKKLYKPDYMFKAAQRWQFWIRLKQPHGFMNPGGFDYEGWLYQQHIRATGYIKINDAKKQFATQLNNRDWLYSLLSLRQKLFDKLSQVTDKTSFSGVLIALALGERSGISQQQWEIFRSTGTSHLVAISGLHIGMLAGFAFIVWLRFWPFIGNASLYLAAPRAAAMGAMVVALIYAALSGFAIPAQRALIMLLVVMLALNQRHRVNSVRVVAIALLSVMLFDPLAVLSPGFWLSFAAVGIIIMAAVGRLHITKSWLHWGRLQWRISLVLLPLLLYLFQQASLISPLANLIAIPLVSFIVVPLVFLGTLFSIIMPNVADALFALTDSIISLLWWCLSHLEEIPLSQWFSAKPAVIELLLSMIGISLITSPKGWPGKYLGIFLVLPLVWPENSLLNNGEAEVTVLDVGQGLSVVVRTSKHTLIYDTGPQFNHEFDTGAAVVVPFLRQKKVKNIDMLILSHQDNDHRGGFHSILQAVQPKRILSSYGEPGSDQCLKGESWVWDEIEFEILNPAKDSRHNKHNNDSCVIHIRSAKQSVLLTGDIEQPAEEKLVRDYEDKLQSNYLVSPHHGSKTSSSRHFLQAVQPDLIVIPVGYKNRYRMPHSVVTKRYQDMKIPYFKTSSSGAVTLRLGQKSSILKPLLYRESMRKYWNSTH